MQEIRVIDWSGPDFAQVVPVDVSYYFNYSVTLIEDTLAYPPVTSFT
jgi:hypothetical protein